MLSLESGKRITRCLCGPTTPTLKQTCHNSVCHLDSISLYFIWRPTFCVPEGKGQLRPTVKMKTLQHSTFPSASDPVSGCRSFCRRTSDIFVIETMRWYCRALPWGTEPLLSQLIAAFSPASSLSLFYTSNILVIAHPSCAWLISPCHRSVTVRAPCFPLQSCCQLHPSDL